MILKRIAKKRRDDLGAMTRMKVTEILKKSLTSFVAWLKR